MTNDDDELTPDDLAEIAEFKQQFTADDFSSMERRWKQRMWLAYCPEQPTNRIQQVWRDTKRQWCIDRGVAIPRELMTLDEFEADINAAWDAITNLHSLPPAEQSHYYVTRRGHSVRMTAVLTGRSKSQVHRDANPAAAERHRTLERERNRRKRATAQQS